MTNIRSPEFIRYIFFFQPKFQCTMYLQASIIQRFRGNWNCQNILPRPPAPPIAGSSLVPSLVRPNTHPSKLEDIRFRPSLSFTFNFRTIRYTDNPFYTLFPLLGDIRIYEMTMPLFENVLCLWATCSALKSYFYNIKELLKPQESFAIEYSLREIFSIWRLRPSVGVFGSAAPTRQRWKSLYFKGWLPRRSGSGIAAEWLTRRPKRRTRFRAPGSNMCKPTDWNWTSDEGAS